MASTLELLKRLVEHKVDFVIVGGVAAVLHGSRMVTQDVHVCAPLSRQNLERILEPLSGLSATFRMAHDQRKLPTTAADLVGYKKLSLSADMGQLDILSHITGIGDYEEVRRRTIVIDLGGAECRVLELEALIAAKRALNLPKDAQAILELEAIRERITRGRG